MNSTSPYSNLDDNSTGRDGDLSSLTHQENTVMALAVATLAVNFVVGTAGNILLCLVISLYSQMRTAFNILVFNLALTDLLLGLLVAPTFAARIVYEMWSAVGPPRAAPSAVIMVVCHISTFTHYVCTVQSLMTMLEMGFIRALAVRKSAKGLRFRISKLVPCALLALNYVIALSYAILNYRQGTFAICLDESTRPSIGNRLTSLGILLGILKVISLTYVWIFVNTKRQRVGVATGRAEAAATLRRPNRFDIATGKALLLVTGAYGVSYIPYIIFVILWKEGRVSDDPKLITIYPALASLSSAANPIIYAFNSGVFRRQLRKLLRLDSVLVKKAVPTIAAHTRPQIPMRTPADQNIM